MSSALAQGSARHSRSVWRGARSRSPEPFCSDSSSAQDRSSRTFCAIDPVVSSTIITSVFEKLICALHATVIGTSLKPKMRMIVVGMRAVAAPATP